MVMDSAAVLVKTDKGAAELAQRSDAVPQKLRAILIMVDGKTQWGELQNRYAALPDFNEHLQWLVENGYIEPAGKTIATGAQAVAHQADTFARGRAGLIDLAQQLLGEHGKNVVQRLQDTEDTQEALTQTLERCHKLIRLSIDEGKAELFLTMGKKLLA